MSTTPLLSTKLEIARQLVHEAVALDTIPMVSLAQVFLSCMEIRGEIFPFTNYPHSHKAEMAFRLASQLFKAGQIHGQS